MATTWLAPLLYCVKVAKVGRAGKTRAGRANNGNQTAKALTRGPWTRSACPAPREPTSLRPACPWEEGGSQADGPACWPAGEFSTSARPQRPPADSAVGTCAPYRAPAPAQHLRKLRLCWNSPAGGCTSPSRPGLAGSFQVQAGGRRACWGSDCWGPTLAGGPRVACPRTESRFLLLFLKGALPLPHRLVPESDQVAFCRACSPGPDESHNEAASRRWTQASGGGWLGVHGRCRPEAISTPTTRHHRLPGAQPQRLGHRVGPASADVPPGSWPARGEVGAGRRPRGALRPPPTPAPAHPAPARALGAGKDGVRSSGGPSEGQPPCRRMAPHERSSLLLVSHSGLSLSCEIDILCHWTQSHSMDAVRTSFYRHSCGHRI